jgi:hypothetical protein
MTTLPYNQRDKALLLALTKCKKNQCKRILSQLENSNTKLICDICSNVVRGNVSVPEDTLKKLKKHKQTLLKLSNRKIGLPIKRKLINQRGGAFLPLLLPLISGLVGSLIK